METFFKWTASGRWNTVLAVKRFKFSFKLASVCRYIYNFSSLYTNPLLHTYAHEHMHTAHNTLLSISQQCLAKGLLVRTSRHYYDLLRHRGLIKEIALWTYIKPHFFWEAINAVFHWSTLRRVLTLWATAFTELAPLSRNLIISAIVLSWAFPDKCCLSGCICKIPAEGC